MALTIKITDDAGKTHTTSIVVQVDEIQNSNFPPFIQRYTVPLLLFSIVTLGKLTHFNVILLPLDEAIASRVVFVIVSGSDGQTADGNAFGAS